MRVLCDAAVSALGLSKVREGASWETEPEMVRVGVKRCMMLSEPSWTFGWAGFIWREGVRDCLRACSLCNRARLLALTRVLYCFFGQGERAVAVCIGIEPYSGAFWDPLACIGDLLYIWVCVKSEGTGVHRFSVRVVPGLL